MVKSTIPLPPPQLLALQAVIQRVCEKHAVARMETFGDATDSPLPLGSEMDLLVEFLPDAKPGLVEMGALREDLEQQLGCRIELLSRQAVERSLNSYRRRIILRNIRTIYAR